MTLLSISTMLGDLVMYLFVLDFQGDGALDASIWDVVGFRLFHVPQQYNTSSSRREFMVITDALKQLWVRVGNIAVFCAVLFFGVATLIGSYPGGSSDHEDVQAVSGEFFPYVWASALTAFTVTTIRLSWAGLTDTMLTPSKRPQPLDLRPRDLALFVIFFMLAFCLTNFFLDIFVHEVLQQPEAYDKTLECLSLLQGETSVQRLEAALNKIDLDQDRNISADERQNALSDKEFSESLGVKPRVLVALDSNLDMEGRSRVPVSEFLFGLLQLPGTSESLDIPTVDYRPKALL